MKLPEFKTQKDLFKHLRENKTRLIGLKKAQIKLCDNILSDPTGLELKGMPASYPDDTDEMITRSIVGNTYGWMDSHDDVHIKGIFTKSINESGHKVMHLHDHVHQLDAEVGDNLKVYETEIEWKEVGHDSTGKATALVMDTEIRKEYNPRIFQKYKKGQIDQHSVGMQYVDIFLCLNDKDDKEHYGNWKNYIDEVKNSEVAEEQGYFWAVTTAKLIEISCVIRGSNELTPTMGNKTALGGFEFAQKLVNEIDDLAVVKRIAELCSLEYGIEPEVPLSPEPPKSTQSKSLYQFIKY